MESVDFASPQSPIIANVNDIISKFRSNKNRND
ncbi:hypothetical protein COLO4_36036 [Corchorus olitorius]|uniref:Uncharacterized protein n=1 Tax=Corchorus olitorius TaxID=93759 RepID=A0A1R3GB81_9ROSI|nr:hypothetical protein COLO4_36036 [Corchorus olitorius]